MKENCKTCYHLIDDPKAPRKGICNAILNGPAVKKGYFFADRKNPRVRIDRGDCVAFYVIEPNRRFAYNPRTGTHTYVPDEWVPAYRPVSKLRRLGRQLSDRFNS